MSEEKNQNELLALRRAKLEELQIKGIAFPNNFRRSSLSKDLHTTYDSLNSEDLEKENIEVAVAGRIMLQRVMGKASFITIQVVSGKIQAYIKSDNICGNIAFTRLNTLVVSTGSTFQVGAGTTLIFDVLNIFP